MVPDSMGKPARCVSFKDYQVWGMGDAIERTDWIPTHLRRFLVKYLFGKDIGSKNRIEKLK